MRVVGPREGLDVAVTQIHERLTVPVVVLAPDVAELVRAERVAECTERAAGFDLGQHRSSPTSTSFASAAALEP